MFEKQLSRGEVVEKGRRSLRVPKAHVMGSKLRDVVAILRKGRRGACAAFG